MVCCNLKMLKIIKNTSFVLSAASHTLRVENWELSDTCPTFHSLLGPNSATTKQQAIAIKSQFLSIKTTICSLHVFHTVNVCVTVSDTRQIDLMFYYWLIKTAFISIHKGAVLYNIIYRRATKDNKAHACAVYNC